MLMKKKSMIVAIASGLVISSVLILTLAGYILYLEIKSEEFKRSYAALLAKVNARVYSRKIEIAGLESKVEISGALKGKAVIEGVFKNNGYREISDILLKVKFLDRDGAVIYETVLRPLEPSLGTSALPDVTIPYLYTPSRASVRPGSSMAFKKILSNCPKEVSAELRGAKGLAKGSDRWPGKLVYEIVSLDF